ncbi:MAG: hypothetical protein HC895_01420 [Leptolyngbyaceae cyanobacterium SM1_3_5]|nr:hypothetical protein [Leptolyngbyaceae cyanobacterium SM1_3_5]
MERNYTTPLDRLFAFCGIEPKQHLKTFARFLQFLMENRQNATATAFGEVPQVQPIARSARPGQPRSTRPPAPRSKQIPLTESIARHPIPDTRHPIDFQPEVASAESIAIAPVPAKELPAGWVSPKDPAFNYLKNCRLCGWPIKHGGLDHSLCSGDCGWVIDKQWEAWNEQRRKRKKEPEPQAATHTSEANDFEGLDLFTYGIEGGEV